VNDAEVNAPGQLGEDKMNSLLRLPRYPA